MSVSGPRYREGTHRRRVRKSAPRRLGGRAFWAIVGVAAGLIVTSGFATAAFVLGTFSSNPFQSSASGTPSSPPGVTYPLAEAQLVNATTTPAAGGCVTPDLGTLAVPTALTSGAKTAICLNTPASGFGSGDIMYILEVQWSSLAATSTEFQVQIGVDVTPSTNDVVAVSYVETSATIAVSEEAIFALDLTAASDTSVVQFNVLITQL